MNVGHFEDIKLKWDGREYTLPSTKVFKAIAAIEEHVTLYEIGSMAKDRGSVSMTRIASAYGSALRIAGADVSDEDVYVGMFKQGGASAANVQAALNGLMGMMIPPDAIRKAAETVAKEGADAALPGKTDPAEVNSSKRPSRRRSATSG